MLLFYSLNTHSEPLSEIKSSINTSDIKSNLGHNLESNSSLTSTSSVSGTIITSLSSNQRINISNKDKERSKGMFLEARMGVGGKGQISNAGNQRSRTQPMNNKSKLPSSTFNIPILQGNSTILHNISILPLALFSSHLQGTWKKLYSTESDGLSFNRIAHHILGYGVRYFIYLVSFYLLNI